MKALLAALLLFASTAQAERTYRRVELKILLVEGEHRISEARALELYRGLYRAYRDIGVSVIRRGKIDVVPDACAVYTGISAFSRLAQLQCWYYYAKDRGMLRPGKLVAVITPPLIANGVAYRAGYARTHHIDGKPYGITVSNLAPVAPEKEYASDNVLQHEVGHNLCADHVSDCSLMDHAVNYCLPGVAKLSPYSVSQVQGCFKKRKSKRRVTRRIDGVRHE